MNEWKLSSKSCLRKCQGKMFLKEYIETSDSYWISLSFLGSLRIWLAAWSLQAAASLKCTVLCDLRVGFSKPVFSWARLHYNPTNMAWAITGSQRVVQYIISRSQDQSISSRLNLHKSWIIGLHWLTLTAPRSLQLRPLLYGFFLGRRNRQWIQLKKADLRT